MRALRFAVIAALISVSVVESTTVFARGTGGNGGAAGGGAAGGGASGGGSGGGGHGFNPQLLVAAPNPPARGPLPRVVIPARAYSACFKQSQLYDRFGDPVVNIYGSECFGE